MSDAAPPLPRAAVLALAVVTVLAVGALSLALFWGDIVEDGATTAATTAGDDFERADTDGLADDDHPWQEPSGRWIVQDGHAAIGGGEEGAVAGLAVLPGEGPSSVEVTATAVEPGWGLAFRVQDAENLWAVVARPDTGSWSLVRIEDGVVDETEGFLAVEPADRALVRVDLSGDVIRVSVGDVANDVTDPALADAADVGLVALPGGSLASMAWDDLTVTT